jgi:hypothetical protein
MEFGINEQNVVDNGITNSESGIRHQKCSYDMAAFEILIVYIVPVVHVNAFVTHRHRMERLGAFQRRLQSVLTCGRRYASVQCGRELGLIVSLRANARSAWPAVNKSLALHSCTCDTTRMVAFNFPQQNATVTQHELNQVTSLAYHIHTFRFIGSWGHRDRFTGS